MKVLVAYDSQYGNTEQVAKAIAGALPGDVRLALATEVLAHEIAGCDLVIVGSPTQGGRPTAGTKIFLGRLGEGSLKGVAVAAFDTRIESRGRGIAMRLLLRTVGRAAPRIASALTAKGGHLALAPEGFYVADKEGPLEDGEVERAAAWGRELAAFVAARDDPTRGARGRLM